MHDTHVTHCHVTSAFPHSLGFPYVLIITAYHQLIIYSYVPLLHQLLVCYYSSLLSLSVASLYFVSPL